MLFGPMAQRWDQLGHSAQTEGWEKYKMEQEESIQQN